MSDAALYNGIVVHRRFVPKPHALRYRMLMALLDIDRLDALARRIRLFSHNRFNLLAFHDRDHLPKDAPPGTTLRSMVDGHLRNAGVALDGGTIRLLTLPRLLGYAFNPISVYFCHRADGTLAAILYEVNNTFKQRHTYVIPVDPQTSGTIHQRCDKAFYVSPFMDMDLIYDFRVMPPDERVTVAVDASKGPTRVIAASFAGKRRQFTDAMLVRSVLGHPLIGLKIVAGIHWEALQIWFKGIGLRDRPAPPEHSATFVTRREA